MQKNFQILCWIIQKPGNSSKFNQIWKFPFSAASFAGSARPPSKVDFGPNMKCCNNLIALGEALKNAKNPKWFYTTQIAPHLPPWVAFLGSNMALPHQAIGAKNWETSEWGRLLLKGSIGCTLLLLSLKWLFPTLHSYYKHVCFWHLAIRLSQNLSFLVDKICKSCSEHKM